MTLLGKIISWLLRRLTFGVILVTAGMIGFGLWMYLRDDLRYEQRREDMARLLTGQRAQMRAALADAEVRLAEFERAIAEQDRRAAEAARIARELQDLNSGISRLSRSADETRQLESRLVRLRTTELEARQRAAELQRDLARTKWEREGLTQALGRIEFQLVEVEAGKSRLLEFIREVWSRYGWLILCGVLLWLVGPSLGRLVCYFLFAPFVSSRKPVRLGAETGHQPELRHGGPSLELELKPDEVLWIKENYLQACDEGLQRRTRWLLDWRMPLTCLAADLKELVELRNTGADLTQRATLSAQHAAQIELAEVEVPAGVSLILRPSYLAGLVGPSGRPAAVIRRHWRILFLQSWATGQFRYFEFTGPCRLLLSGTRGVRAEMLGGPERPGARRMNQDATLGFTPGLAYRPVRAETFWTYFRGQNPLFDDLFEGRGLVLAQQTSARGEAAEQRGFVAGLRDALLRIFGL
jgi:hypothetical protein